MIQVAKDEAMAIRSKYGDDVGITITNRHKKGGRKRYYVEETNRVMFFLERYRNKQLRKAQKKQGVGL